MNKIVSREDNDTNIKSNKMVDIQFSSHGVCLE